MSKTFFTRVKVLGNKYTIHRTDELDENVLGEIDYIHREILIRRDANIESQILTVGHELAHAYLYHIGLPEKLNHGSVEMIVQNMSLFLVDCIKNNSHLINFMGG